MLVALDSGVAWVLARAGVNQPALADELARAYPPPRRAAFIGVERHFGHRRRLHDLVRRYERATGRVTTSPLNLDRLVTGAA